MKKTLNGLQILIVGPRFGYPEMLSIFYQHAFESLGATVGGVCTRTKKLWGADVKPDVALFIKSDARADFHKWLKKTYGCKLILYWPDTLEDYTNYEVVGTVKRSNFEHLKRVRGLYDEAFIFASYPKEQLSELDMKWLPLAYDPLIHFPPDPIPVKSTAILWIGTYKPGRRFFVELKPVPEVYGNGWEDFFKTRDVYLEEKRHLMAEARIMLDEHHQNVGPNHRFFETLAGGTFLLTDYVPGMQKLGVSSSTCGLYEHGSAKDAQEKVTYFLEHEEEREKIAAAGREAVKNQTYASRAMEMLGH